MAEVQAFAYLKDGEGKASIKVIEPGGFVLLEKLNKNKSNLEYGSGEYVVTRVTPHAIYGVKPIVGYGFHDEKSFLIAGNDPWSVSSYRFNKEAAISLAKENISWGDAGGKQWVDSLYKEAAKNGRTLLQGLGIFEPVVTAYNYNNVAAVKPVPYTLSPALEKICDKFGCEAGHAKEFARQLLAEIKGVN